jgi:hypothetical protein
VGSKEVHSKQCTVYTIVIPIDNMASYYQNLDVWKKAYSLNKELFFLLKKFPKEEQYSLVDQMRRSGLSIASNIAE